ncbi:peroxisomal membrane protein 11A isoform X2 [Carcharodon carcharias]|uniref:peroxisomal membrane protein 11A isoform X2 n=1 Tax=Carcharodon carcharias TaxID=13397 RepID=UPI001B7DB0D7|nr:peroxisomal membrane protein 11A isoform X2 [Carcharodon carcharias]
MSGDRQNNYTESKENFIKRFSSLLAVSSTCDIFYNIYHDTMDKYPVVASVWEISEGGIKRTTALALKSMQPVLQKLQPQIAVANDYACKGLDHLEERFPVLHKDSTKIMSDVKEMAARKMKSLRENVTNPILLVSDKAINVVTYSLEKTKVLVNESVTSVLSNVIGRSITHGVDASLSKSEQLADSCLPNEDGNEEDRPSEETISSFKLPHRNYTQVYLLASKLYNHAFKLVVMFVQNAKKQKQEIIALVPAVCFAGTSAKENLDIAGSNPKVQGPINRRALSSHTNMEGQQKKCGVAEPAVPGLHESFESVFSDIVANLNEISNAVQMKKQQVFKTIQKLSSQLWSSDLAISLGHFVSQLKGKLWDVWQARYMRIDDVLSYLASTLLLPGTSVEDNEVKFETEENKSQGWRSLVPRLAKEGGIVQISEGNPEPQITQGRQNESISSENMIFTTVTEAEGGMSVFSSSGQSEKEGKCPESEIAGEQSQKNLEQHSAQMPMFQEQQAIGEDFRESELRCPNPF